MHAPPWTGGSGKPPPRGWLTTPAGRAVVGSLSQAPDSFSDRLTFVLSRPRPLFRAPRATPWKRLPAAPQVTPSGQRSLPVLPLTALLPPLHATSRASKFQEHKPAAPRQAGQRFSVCGGLASRRALGLAQVNAYENSWPGWVAPSVGALSCTPTRPGRHFPREHLPRSPLPPCWGARGRQPILCVSLSPSPILPFSFPPPPPPPLPLKVNTSSSEDGKRRLCRTVSLPQAWGEDGSP